MAVDIQPLRLATVLRELRILVGAEVALILVLVTLNLVAPVAPASLLFVTQQTLTPRHQ
jgi:hypothetical protein